MSYCSVGLFLKLNTGKSLLIAVFKYVRSPIQQFLNSLYSCANAGKCIFYYIIFFVWWQILIV